MVKNNQYHQQRSEKDEQLCLRHSRECGNRCRATGAARTIFGSDKKERIRLHRIPRLGAIDSRIRGKDED